MFPSDAASLPLKGNNDFTNSAKVGSASLTMTRTRKNSTHSNSTTRTNTPTPEKGFIGDLSGRKVSKSRSKSEADLNGNFDTSTRRFQPIKEGDETEFDSTKRDVKEPAEHRRITSAMQVKPQLNRTGSQSVAHHSNNLSLHAISKSKEKGSNITEESLEQFKSYEGWLQKFDQEITGSYIPDDIKRSIKGKSSEDLATSIISKLGDKISQLITNAMQENIKVYFVVKKLMDVISKDLEQAGYRKDIQKKAGSIVSCIINALKPTLDEAHYPEYRVHLHACATRWGKEPLKAVDLLTSIEEYRTIIERKTITDDRDEEVADDLEEYQGVVEGILTEISKKLTLFGYSAPDQSNHTEAAEILHRILVNTPNLSQAQADKYKKLQFINLYFRALNHEDFQKQLANLGRVWGDKLADIEKGMKEKISKEILKTQLEKEVLVFRKKSKDELSEEQESLYKSFIHERFKSHDLFPEYMKYRLNYLAHRSHLLNSQAKKNLSLAELTKYYDIGIENFRLSEIKNQFHYFPSTVIEELVCDTRLSNSFSLVPKVQDFRTKFAAYFLMKKLQILHNFFWQTVKNDAANQKYNRIRWILTVIESRVSQFKIDGIMDIMTFQKQLVKTRLDIKTLIDHQKTYPIIIAFRKCLNDLIETIKVDKETKMEKEVIEILKKLKAVAGQNPDQIVQELLKEFEEILREFDHNFSQFKLLSYSMLTLKIEKSSDERICDAIKAKVDMLNIFIQEHERLYSSDTGIVEARLLPFEDKLMEIILNDLTVDFNKKREDEIAKQCRLTAERERELEKELTADQAKDETALATTLCNWLKESGR